MVFRGAREAAAVVLFGSLCLPWLLHQTQVVLWTGIGLLVAWLLWTTIRTVKGAKKSWLKLISVAASVATVASWVAILTMDADKRGGGVVQVVVGVMAALILVCVGQTGRSQNEADS